MAGRGMDATADEIHLQHELRLLMAKADLIAAIRKYRVQLSFFRYYGVADELQGDSRGDT